MSSFALTLIIAIAALLVGVVVFFVQRFKLYRGYEEIAGDARKIASALKAEVFRDGDDLVLSGSYGGFPTVVRFSHGQNTPGLNIQMRSAAAFDLSLSPKKVTTAKGRTVVRTGNNSLDARFSARTTLRAVRDGSLPMNQAGTGSGMLTLPWNDGPSSGIASP